MSHSGRNIPASVLSRLLIISKEHDEEYQSLLTRYIAERFLYRLGKSTYRDTFVLKGAYLLTLILDKFDFRPTKDIDFLNTGESDPEYLLIAIREICLIPCADDGVSFAIETIQIQPIREQNAYHGQRVTLLSFIGNARIKLQIDIGTGDAVFPTAQTRTMKPMLDLDAPTISSYPIETIVAEKVEACVTLSLLTSRMKDFYDLFVISRYLNFEFTPLISAVEKTFSRRGTEIPTKRPAVFDNAIINDPQKQIQWNAFTKKIRSEDHPLAFIEVIHQIQRFTDTFWRDRANTFQRWDPDQGWR